jgi:hypothetical protein
MPVSRKTLYFAVTNDLNFDQRMIRICSCLQESNFDVHLVGRKKKKLPFPFCTTVSTTPFALFFFHGPFFLLGIQHSAVLLSIVTANGWGDCH